MLKKILAVTCAGLLLHLRNSFLSSAAVTVRGSVTSLSSAAHVGISFLPAIPQWFPLLPA